MSDTATIASKQNPLQYVTDELKDLRARGVAPKLRVLEGEQKPVCIFDGREVINLASNNYLGLTTHKALRKAALDAVKRYGAGAGGADCGVQERGSVRGVSVGLHGERRNSFGSARQGRSDCFRRIESCVD